MSCTKMMLINFFVRCTVFEIFAILCFLDSDEIHISDYNSETIGRSNLKQRPLDSSRRAAQKWYQNIFTSDAPFSSYLRFCVFLDWHKIYLFDHNSKTIGPRNLKQKPLDSPRRTMQKWCITFFCAMHGFLDIRVFVGFLPLGSPAGGVLSSPVSVRCLSVRP